MKTQKKGRHRKYGRPITDKICEYLSKGKYSQAQISRKVGIHPDTFSEWLKTHPEFKEAVEAAKKSYLDSLGIEARCALERRLKGFHETDTRTVKRPDEQGELAVAEVVETRRYIAPDTTAIIFALTNTDPANWKNRHSADVEVKEDSVCRLTMEQAQELLRKLEKEY